MQFVYFTLYTSELNEKETGTLLSEISAQIQICSFKETILPQELTLLRPIKENSKLSCSMPHILLPAHFFQDKTIACRIYKLVTLL